MSIHLVQKIQIALLLAKKVTIPNEYLDFTNVFSKKLAVELPKRSDINKYVINLEPGNQSSYSSIYSLGLIELKTLKTYIETNLANDFIWPSKFPSRASILFVWKLDGSLYQCVNYCSFNNFTIKNQYLLSLIGKLLDWLSQAKQFTQFDLTSAYHCIRIKGGNE